MCGLEVEPQGDGSEADISGDGAVVAVISLVGDVEWSIHLGLPRDTAIGVTSQFFGFEIPFDSDDMGDAVGELANIIAGDVKAKLDTRGLKVELSLPSVVRGEHMELLSPRSLPTQTTVYTSPCGSMWTAVVAGITNHGT